MTLVTQSSLLVLVGFMSRHTKWHQIVPKLLNPPSFLSFYFVHTQLSLPFSIFTITKHPLIHN